MGEIWVVAHGETEWSAAGRLTGRTDQGLTDVGEEQARGLTLRLNRDWDAVLTSPLSRAARTAELAGFQPRLDPDLVEWDFGTAEGRTREDLSAARPWSEWDDPRGEPLEAVRARVRGLLHRLPEGDVLLFGHSHVLRVLAAVHLGLHPGAGRHLVLSPARIGILTRDPREPALRAWNL